MGVYAEIDRERAERAARRMERMERERRIRRVVGPLSCLMQAVAGLLFIYMVMVWSTL